jgi:arylsulfatase
MLQAERHKTPPTEVANMFVLLMLMTFFACSSKYRDKISTRPNILLILVDDMGYSDIGCYGGEIPTPNIDALAGQGLRMTQFYNAARCCPSRASLLTGLYPHQAGMGHQNQDRGHPAYRGHITNNATTIAEALGANGYRAYHVGKWHVGSRREYWPDKKGFDQYFSLIEGAMNYYNQWPWVKGQDSLELTYNGMPYHTRSGFYATATFSDSAAAFIRRHDGAKPFFMYLAYNAPHWPLHAPQQEVDRYRGTYLAGWDSIRSTRFRRLKELGLLKPEAVLSERFHSIPDWDVLDPTAKQDWDLKMALYAAVMDNLDRGIGTVIGALESKGQLNNTLIIFLSDNGGCHEDPVPPEAPWVVHPTDGRPGSPRSFPAYAIPWANVSNTPFSYFKSFVHEGGIATPFIVRYPPMIPAGAVNNNTAGHIMDILPTLLDFTGIVYPSEIADRQITLASGISLLPSWRGEPQNRNTPVFWEHQFNRAVRHDNWKLVSAYKILEKPGIYNKWELYNLAEDPTEQTDLVGTYPDKADSLKAMYNAWAAETQVLGPKAMQQLMKNKK